MQILAALRVDRGRSSLLEKIFRRAQCEYLGSILNVLSYLLRRNGF